MKPLYDQQEFERRADSFDYPIRKLGMTNVFVHRIIQEYACGHIVTKEEALCQMIIGLCTSWTELQEKYCSIMMDITRPVIVPPPPPSFK